MSLASPMEIQRLIIISLLEFITLKEALILYIRSPSSERSSVEKFLKHHSVGDNFTSEQVWVLVLTS